QDALFADLQVYMQQANPVVIDLSRTHRIDFVNAGRLLHLIEKARAAKRTVVLRSVGEMVIALFAVMGIHKQARIIPRK
ncbi:MAG: STAS domain-containing protein, partial [Burkholderiales bacterium]|nr:STAS domain-containing protein [Burkholderiales bacterium]